MAEEKQDGAAPKKELPKYDEKLAAKYKISTVLQPAKVDLGSRYGRIEVDLRKPESLEVIDAFCKKYPEQTLFTLKDNKPSNPGQK